MIITTSFLLFLLSLFLLYIGGESVVKGAVLIASKLQIPVLIIGLTVVSFATSLPEVFVSVEALLKGNSNIALGNVFGSNIANIALVLGLTTIISKLNISKDTIYINYPFLLFVTFLIGFIFYFFGSLSSFSGFFLISLLILFLYFLISRNNNQPLNSSLDNNKPSNINVSLFNGLLFLIFGIILLRYGAYLLIEQTILIAEFFNIPDRVIAATIVAFGTSIPELVTSVIAAIRKQVDLAVGNLIGSNIFNLLAVLGFSSVISDIVIDDFAILNFDYLFMLFTTILVSLFIYFNSIKQINRIHGIILVLVYFIYVCLNIL